ncbi:MAG: hypothetical protein NXH75_10860 [Halobacteriovoraceae bacterium]|nr:hypothetical protein [Halobacteriovoraceae bacterium]
MRRNLFEEVFGESVYTLNSFDDASFRIPDFGPDLILIGQELAVELGLEEMELLASSEIPFAAVCEKEVGKSLVSKGWDEKFLELPLDAMAMTSTVETLLNELRV